MGEDCMILIKPKEDLNPKLDKKVMAEEMDPGFRPPKHLDFTPKKGQCSVREHIMSIKNGQGIKYPDVFFIKSTRINRYFRIETLSKKKTSRLPLSSSQS